MQQQTYIRAIYTPEKYTPEGGVQPLPDNATSVTIIAFSNDVLRAVFVDEEGLLGRGHIGQFSDCVLDDTPIRKGFHYNIDKACLKAMQP